jgi:hypothetical protein
MCLVGARHCGVVLVGNDRVGQQNQVDNTYFTRNCWNRSWECQSWRSSWTRFSIPLLFPCGRTTPLHVASPLGTRTRNLDSCGPERLSPRTVPLSPLAVTTTRGEDHRTGTRVFRPLVNSAQIQTIVGFSASAAPGGFGRPLATLTPISQLATPGRCHDNSLASLSGRQY